MSETKLLPCPFCGGEPHKRLIGNDHSSKRSCEIKCGKCKIGGTTSVLRFPITQAEEWAIAAWNTRALTPEQAAAGDMREALRIIDRAISGFRADGTVSRSGIEFTDDERTFIRAALAKAGRS